MVVAPGPIFEVPGDEDAAGFEGHVRLCFAWEEEWKLGEGVRRVGEVVRRMLDDSQNGGGGYGVVDKSGGSGRLDAYK